jgi:nucleotide-binding universal stress UspA family protein
VANPPADLAILRARPFTTLRRILVPVAGGSNSRLAASTARALAASSEGETKVILVHVVLNEEEATVAEAHAQNAFRRAIEGTSFPFETQVVNGDDPVEGILRAAEDCDMVVIGATKEPLFRNLLMGNVSQRVADQAGCPVLIVKRRSPILHSMLRETVLQPIRESRKIKT